MQTVDCINNIAQNTRKMFVEPALPKLYWWDVYSAMISTGKTFITRCRLKGTDLVLVYILKTRCFKPHIDILVYDINAKKAFVLQQTKCRWQNLYECDLHLRDFDEDDLNR